MTIDNINKCLSSFWPEWQAVRTIGAGSHGTVYHARCTKEGHISYGAIKVISVPESEAEANAFMASEGMNTDTARNYYRDIVNRYIAEVRIMDSLKNIPNIVRIEKSKVIESSDKVGFEIFILMELLTPFVDYQRQKQPFDQEDAIKVGMDLCSALKACEKHNIIHRDIKPENIFASDDGTFKLGDFGVARKLETKTVSLSHKGTYTYMAPEVYKGKPYDETADIYSLGLVLYWLLNKNRVPFLSTEKQLVTYQERETALALRMSGETLPPPCGAGEALSTIILKACSYDPGGRYQSVSEMYDALEAALDSIKKGAGSKQCFPKRTASSRKSRGKKAAVLLAYTGLAAIIIYLIAANLTEKKPADDSGQISASSEATVQPSSESETAVDSSAFDKSGITDHAMKWNDEALANAMSDLTGKPADSILLSDIWEYRELYLNEKNIKDISDLSELTNLDVLTLSGNLITDVSPLDSLAGLTHLDLNNNSISDCSALASLTKLNTLYLSGNELDDTGFLSLLTSVKTLDLSENRLKSCDEILHLTGLEKLYLGGNKLESFPDLSSLNALSVLDVSGTGLDSLKITEKLTGLSMLFAGNNNITDLSYISGLTGLTNLDLQDNPVKDISALSGLTRVEWLDLENCPVADISVLSGLFSLKSLDLSGCSLPDISALSNLANISWLDISTNMISGPLDALTNMHGLRYLDARNNSVTDISSLAGLKELKYLYLSGNPLDKNDIPEGLDLEECDLT